VDRSALEALLADLDQSLDALHIQKSGIGQALRENEFLYGIRQRSSIPGGTCEFDLPAYHFWLQHTVPEERTEQCFSWLNEFQSVRKAVEMSLRLIRGSVGFREETAEEGFFPAQPGYQPAFPAYSRTNTQYRQLFSGSEWRQAPFHCPFYGI
jgi:cell division protein ZapD